MPPTDAAVSDQGRPSRSRRPPPAAGHHPPFAIAGGLAWGGALAGWPREQVLITGILAATVLLWGHRSAAALCHRLRLDCLSTAAAGEPGNWRWLGLGTFFSNTAIGSMLMPVAVIAAGTATGGLDVTSYALTIALVASLSMALPVSTPPNAMAYASGEFTTGDFVRTGGYIGIAGTVVVIVLMGFIRPWIGAIW